MVPIVISWLQWKLLIRGFIAVTPVCHSSIYGSDYPHRTTALYHFDQLPIDPIKIVCLQQEKWISGGKTFDMLCLFCRSYELICAWKGWLYASLWKLLFVFLYHSHFGGHWTTFLQIIMSKFNVMNFHHLFYKTCTYTHTSNTTNSACARPPDEKDTSLNDRRLTLQSFSKIKIKIRKKCFSYFYFYFWNFKRLIIIFID